MAKEDARNSDDTGRFFLGKCGKFRRGTQFVPVTVLTWAQHALMVLIPCAGHIM